MEDLAMQITLAEINELGEDWDFEASMDILDEIDQATKDKDPDNSLEISQRMIYEEVNKFQQCHGEDKANQLVRELLMMLTGRVYYHPE